MFYKGSVAQGSGGGSGGTVDQDYNPLSTNAQSGTAVAQALETISGGADIDDSTITKNASNKIQAVGLVNQNTASGATNPLSLFDYLQRYNRRYLYCST